MSLKSTRLRNVYIILGISLFLSVNAAAAVQGGLYALFGSGSMGNSTDVLSRAMGYNTVGLFGTFNIKKFKRLEKFRLGVNYETTIVGQTAEPSTVSNQNIGGTSSGAGVRLEYYNGKTAFGLIYRMSDKYTMSKPTLNGSTSTYDGTSGFGIQFQRKLKNRIGIVLDYSMGTYNSPTASTDDLTWTRATLGIVFSNFDK
jgi:hypothetical protein